MPRLGQFSGLKGWNLTWSAWNIMGRRADEDVLMCLDLIGLAAALSTIKLHQLGVIRDALNSEGDNEKVAI